MTQGKYSVEIIPAKKIPDLEPAVLWERISLYSQPWFLEVVAPGNAFYARLTPITNGGTATYFPFCGQKILWKWRLFQPSFCQRFEPFSPDNEVLDEAFETWFQFLNSNSWKADWPFGIPEGKNQLFGNSYRILKRTNYIFAISDELKEMLGRWSGSRRNKLNRAGHLTMQLLDSELFLSRLLAFKNDGENLWRPSTKEFKLVQAILATAKCETYLILDGEKPLALSLMLEWNGRFHYLMSVSNSQGLQHEAMAFFFRAFMDLKKGTGKMIDFEGSNLPGVASYFKSLGATTETYGLWQK